MPYKGEMERAFGQDFSGVRAHTGKGEATAALSAAAAAQGDQVICRSASPDKEAVAHKLTHVVQQREGGEGSVQGKGGVSQPGDAAEVETDRVAARIAAGGQAGPSGATPQTSVSLKSSGGGIEVLAITQVEKTKYHIAFDAEGSDVYRTQMLHAEGVPVTFVVVRVGKAIAYAETRHLDAIVAVHYLFAGPPAVEVASEPETEYPRRA